MVNGRKTLVLLIIASMILRCAPISKMSYSNLAYLYDPETNVTGLECVPYHVSDDITEIFVRLKYSSLLYEKKTGSEHYKANFSIHYELFDASNARLLVDSGLRLFADSLHYESEDLFSSSFRISTIYPGDFTLSVTLRDLNRKYTYDTFLEVQKKSTLGRQNFLLTDENGDVLFQPIVKANQVVRIKCNNPDQSHLFVRYYRRDFPIAAPPFNSEEQSVFGYEADSLMDVRLADGETGFLDFRNPGFYHFQKDTVSHEGYTVFVFYEGFPEVVSPGQMLFPVRYLTTRKEYEKMISNPDIRKAVEDFWISNAGNQERAAIQIRKFYTRVQEANLLFTSYMEGWKTDRGMIYTIYGRPTVVYRNEYAEQWIYGKEGNLLSITFNFVRVLNPFTEKDYQLERTPEYKESWYTSVDGWRR